jgi:hypothetical protein
MESLAQTMEGAQFAILLIALTITFAIFKKFTKQWNDHSIPK